MSSTTYNTVHTKLKIKVKALSNLNERVRDFINNLTAGLQRTKFKNKAQNIQRITYTTWGYILQEFRFRTEEATGKSS